MIYPWYDSKRWIVERSTGDETKARALLQEFCPSPATAYFRHSYASFRVNGLEYARMGLNGNIRYGIKYAPLSQAAISPPDLVSALDQMFRLLADSQGDPVVVEQWAGRFSADIATFFRHTARNHQAEHWLESKLLLKPSVIGKSVPENDIRSQVVVCEQGAPPSDRRFIDLLALDRANKFLWVVELKVPKADKRAVRQAREYAEWVNAHITELLDEFTGYFNRVENPEAYKTAIAFMAPDYTSNFCAEINRDLASYRDRVKVMRVNADWRKTINIERKPICNEERQMTDYQERWANDKLTVRIVQLAKEVSLYPCKPPKSDYINLCVGCKSGNVRAQIHKHQNQERGRMLVLRAVPQGLELPKPLHIVENFEELSGDVYSNKPWLRATGENFGHFSRATAVFVPNSILSESNDSEVWSALRKLLKYASENI